MHGYKKAPPKDKRSLFSSGRDSISSGFHFKYSIEYDLLFNLIAPASSEGEWILEYYMRSTNDPWLMYPVHAIMDSAKHPSGDESLWSLRIQTARKVSLASKHSAYAPGSERDTQPRHLTREEAYEFITEDAFLLREAGFIVQVPEIDVSGVVPRLILRSEKRGGRAWGVLDAGGILSFGYSVGIGDRMISGRDFMAYAKTKTRLIMVGDRWVSVDPMLMRGVASLISLPRGWGSGIIFLFL